MRPLPQAKKPIALDVSLAIVNIVLLLIFFFLATGQLLNPPAADVDLAETSELPLDQLPSPVLVVVADGSWELDGAQVAPDLLEVALEPLERPLTLHILMNKDAPATSLISVMNRPELAEAELRLVTLRTAGAEE